MHMSTLTEVQIKNTIQEMLKGHQCIMKAQGTRVVDEFRSELKGFKRLKLLQGLKNGIN